MTSVEQLLSQIYVDIDAASRLTFPANSTTPHPPLSSSSRQILTIIEYARYSDYPNNVCAEVSEAARHMTNDADSSTARFGAQPARRLIRYRDFVDDHGWMLLSIMVFSAHFRNAADSLSVRDWTILGGMLLTNRSSLELFAKIRGLNWHAPLQHEPGLLTLLTPKKLMESFPWVQKDHPHHWVVPEPGNSLIRANGNGQIQSIIQDNQYSPALFGRYPRPDSWPREWPYPHNPTSRRPCNGPCANCSSTKKDFCDCHPTTCKKVTRPLVELRTYPERGTGVRNLQGIKKGDMLDEFVGELLPMNGPQDEDYGATLDIFPSDSKADPVAQISARVVGNWVRYINHSCVPAVEIHTMAFGKKLRVMIVALRDIAEFEELTMDYGDDYWDENRLCLCGEESCRFKTKSQIMKNRGKPKRKSELKDEIGGKRRRLR